MLNIRKHKTKPITKSNSISGIKKLSHRLIVAICCFIESISFVLKYRDR
jgi:hypothetical protein